MVRQKWNFLVAIFLILFGVVILLNNLKIIPWNINTMQWFWLIVFGGAGILFLAVYLTERQNWWAAIPGFTLLGLAVLMSNILPGGGEAGGGVFLGMIGLSFWLIYIQKRDFWWAIIPGGVLITLAVVSMITGPLGGVASGAAFFIGMGLTFLLVYLLTNNSDRQRWAIWPAGILGGLGLLLSLGASEIGKYLVPIALIFLGGWLVIRTAIRKGNG